MEASGAIRNGKTTHPTITKFWLEQAMHQRMGIVVDPRPLGQRPWREVQEYLTLLEMQVREERRRAEAANRQVR